MSFQIPDITLRRENGSRTVERCNCVVDDVSFVVDVKRFENANWVAVDGELIVMLAVEGIRSVDLSL
jgi:hypothetical protein